MEAKIQDLDSKNNLFLALKLRHPMVEEQWGRRERERNVGLECRERETNREKEKRREIERVRCQISLGSEISLEYNK